MSAWFQSRGGRRDYVAAMVAEQRRLEGLAVDMRGPAVDRMTGGAAFAIKRRAIGEAARDLGAERRMSRFGQQAKTRGKARAGAGYDVAEGTGRARVNMRPAALWGLLEAGARPHLIGTRRRTRSGGYRNRKVYRATAKGAGRAVQVHAIPGAGWRGEGVVSGPINHPGAKPRNTFARVARQAPSDAQQGVHEVMQMVLRDRGY